MRTSPGAACGISICFLSFYNGSCNISVSNDNMILTGIIPVSGHYRINKVKRGLKIVRIGFLAFAAPFTPFALGADSDFLYLGVGAAFISIPISYLSIIIEGSSNFPGQTGKNDNNFHIEDFQNSISHIIVGLLKLHIERNIS